MKRLHITGCPRSGTTLLVTMVTTCFEYEGNYQREESIFRKVPDNNLDLYISKKPADVRHVQHIFYKDPELFLLHIVRDPRSVITSKHYSDRSRYFCNYRVWEATEKAARKYAGHERFLCVRYEDLVTDPDKVQAQIQQAFPFLKKKISFSEYHAHANPSENTAGALNGLRATDKKRVEGWKQHLPRVKEQLQRRPGMQLALMEHGYETDDSWMKMLEDVKAEKFPCRSVEDKSIFKRLEQSIRHWWRSKKYLADR